MLTPSVSYGKALLEEICLEGLDGITPESLWLRMSSRFESDISESLKRRFWTIVRSTKQLSFYSLPEPRKPIVVCDKFDNSIDMHFIIDDHIEEPYPYFPVEGKYGSCQFYDSRKDVSEEIEQISYEEVCDRWYNCLVMVGSDESRWRALAPNAPISLRDTLSTLQYCALEKIGRSRYNGELTHGRYSLNMIERNPKVLFYICKFLASHSLIMKQHVNIRIGGNSGNVSVLVHLNRFYTLKSQEICEKIEIIKKFLKQQPDNMAAFGAISSMLSMKHKSLRRILTRSRFINQFSIIPGIPYRKMYPDASENQFKYANGEERFITAVQWIGDLNDSVDNKDNEDVKRESSFIINEGLLEQTYKAIRKSKNDGLTLKEIQKELGSNYSTTKYATRYLGARGFLYVNVVDEKRQRTAKYILNEFQNISEQKREEQNKSKILLSEATCYDEKIDCENRNVCDEEKAKQLLKNVNNSEFQASIISENKDIQKVSIFPSLRKYRRTNIILEYLQKNHITSNLIDILKYIIKIETQNKDSGGNMDKRSLKRLLFQMESDKHLKIFRVKVSIEPFHSLLMFICENNIDIQHQYVKSTIDGVKQRLMMKKSKLSIEHKVYPSIKFHQIKEHSNYLNPHPQLPKFSKMRVMHELLFYLLYEHKGEVIQYPENVVNVINNGDCFINGLPPYYDNALDKCIFVPPLDVTLYNRPKGWVLLSDVIDRLPLCLFSNLAYADVNIPDILSYLRDPIRSQFLVTSLPANIQYYLTLRKKHKYLIHRCIKHLCLLGLVQFGDQVMKDKDRVYFYFNSNAILVDTTPSKPGYHIVEKKEYSTERFTFKTLKDVRAYWDRMFFICHNTRLGERYAALGTEVECELPEVKLASYLQKRSPEEVTEFDIGYIPGDGDGAAGFDSMIFSHLKRSWNTSSQVCLDSKILKAVPKRRQANDVKKDLFQRSPKISKNVRVLMPRRITRNRTPKLDDLDKMIMERPGSKRCVWSHIEDQILFLSRVAYLISHGNNRFLYFSTVRDILLKVFHSSDKSSSAVRRRMRFMMKKHQNIRYVKIMLSESLRCNIINQKYNNIYNKLKLEYAKDILERDRICQIRFVELVYLLYRRLLEKNLKSQLFVMLPTTVSEFHDMYMVDNSSTDTSNEITQDLNTLSKIRVSVLSSIIHSALWCSICKGNYTFSLLNIYRKFPETILRTTVYSLRSSGMISLKSFFEKSYEKNMNQRRMFCHASCYKLSYNYLAQSTMMFPFKIYSQAHQYINSLKISMESDDHCNVSAGMTAALIELANADYVKIKIISENMTDDRISNIDVVRFDSDKNIMENNDIPSNSCDTFIPIADIAKDNAVYKNSFILNPCEYKVILQCDLEKILDMSQKKVDSTLNNIITDSRLFLNNEVAVPEIPLDSDFLFQGELNLSKDIYMFIHKKFEIGVDYQDLKMEFIDKNTCSKSQLYIFLNHLTEMNLIRRLPYITFRWVANTFLKCWFTDVTPPRYRIKRNIKNAENDRIHSAEGDNEKNTETIENLKGSNDDNCRKRTISENNHDADVKKNRTDAGQEDNIFMSAIDNIENDQIKKNMESAIRDRIHSTEGDNENIAETMENLVENAAFTHLEGSDNVNCRKRTISENDHDASIKKNLTDAGQEEKDNIFMSAIDNIENNQIKKNNQNIAETMENLVENAEFTHLEGSDDVNCRKRKISESDHEVDVKKIRIDEVQEEEEEDNVFSWTSDDIEKGQIEDSDVLCTNEEKYVISPRPWIRPNGSLNHYVFFRWAGAILNHLLNNSLVKYTDLKDQFTFLDLHHIRLLLEALQTMGCIQFVCVESKKPTLWSKNLSLQTRKVHSDGFEDDNRLFVEVLPSAFLKFTMFKGYSK